MFSVFFVSRFFSQGKVSGSRLNAQPDVRRICLRGHHGKTPRRKQLEQMLRKTSCLFFVSILSLEVLVG